MVLLTITRHLSLLLLLLLALLGATDEEQRDVT